MSRKPYIVIEGLDGIGKSTLVKAVTERLLDIGPVASIFEPGTTTAGKELREIMKTPGNNLSRRTELFMMMASRSDIIEKHLSDGAMTVLSDRCWLSSAAYQVTAAPEMLGVFQASLKLLEQNHPRGILFIIDGTMEQVRARNPKFGEGRDPIENASDELWARRERMYHYLANGYRVRKEMIAEPAYVEEPGLLHTVDQCVNRFFKAVIRVPGHQTKEQMVDTVMEQLDLLESFGSTNRLIM